MHPTKFFLQRIHSGCSIFHDIQRSFRGSCWPAMTKTCVHFPLSTFLMTPYPESLEIGTKMWFIPFYCTLWMRSSLCGWDLALWMRQSLVVRASDCQWRSRNSPGPDRSILRHRGGRFSSVEYSTVKKSKIPLLKMYMWFIPFSIRGPFPYGPFLYIQ